jgi:hypothetical protein
MGRNSVTPGADGTVRHRFIKINPEQCYGDRPFQVVGEDARHFTLKSQTPGEPNFQIYKVHTYRDAECIRLSVQSSKEQKAKNARIGLNRTA